MARMGLGTALAAVLLAFGQPATAVPVPDAFHIYATSWGITLAEDGTGFYNDLARFLLGPEIEAKRYTVAPYRRAMRSFLENGDSCVFPKSLETLYRTGDWSAKDRLLESDGLMRSPIRIFSPDGKPVLHTEADLSGKRIAYAMGAKIPLSIIAKDVTFIPIADEVAKAKLLKTGTVDGIVANMPDVLFVFRHLGEPLPPYDPDFEPVTTPIIRVVCHDTPGNRAFLRSFNARINHAVSDGTMADFLTRHDLKPDTFLPPSGH